MRYLFALLIAAIAWWNAAYAQQPPADYPSKVVRIIVPFAPGGQSDIASRIYAQKLSEDLKVPFIVENRPGAGGNVGYNMLMKSPPDGYTIAYTSPAFTYQPFLSKDPAYDPVKDFTPIIVTTQTPYIFTVHPALPVKTFKEYLALVRTHPKQLNYGTSGVGSLIHLAGEWIHAATNTKVTFIPYKGSGDLNVALLSGELQVSSTTPIAAMSYIKAGKMRALAVTSTTRIPQLPDVPTIAELNIPGLQGFSLTSWAGYVGPAGMPEPIVKKLNNEWIRVLKRPDVADKLEGADVVGSTPEEFSQRIVTEANRWRKIIKDTGIKLE